MTEEISNFVQEDDVDDTWMVDHEANLQAVVLEKIRETNTPGRRVLFDPDEADLAGAFEEDALSEQEALDSVIDLKEALGLVSQNVVED